MVNQTCPPTLRRGSKIFICGEAPGATEIDKQEGFVGSSGRILDKILRYAVVKRDECSLSNVAKEQPPGNNFGFFYQDPSSRKNPQPLLLSYYRQLAQEIKQVKPNVIVAVGEEALKALTNKSGITKYRGSILPCTLAPGYKVVPMLHPAWILRGNFKHFWNNVSDMQKARRQSEFRDIRLPKWTSITVPSAKQVLDYLDGVPADALWSLDIETSKNFISCLSVAYDKYAMCIPFERTGGANYFPSDEASIWLALQDLMTRNPNLVGQNLCFDLDWLLERGLEPSGIYMDTMIAHSVAYAEFPRGLDFLASLYTDMPYWKSEGKVNAGRIAESQFYEYNNKDSYGTLLCAQEIEKELRQRNLWNFYRDYVNKELGIALEMQRIRLPVSHENRTKLKDFVSNELKEVRNKWKSNEEYVVSAIAGKPYTYPSDLNVNSPKQVQHFLYETLGLKPKKKRGAVGLSSDENAIMELRAENPNIKALGWILQERHLRKLQSSYLDIDLDEQGRLEGSWYVCGTETGRWTSGKNSRGRGLNIQTIPKPVRHMIVPPPGHIFICPDLAQAEARVVAYLSGCEKLIELFNDPSKSIHMENGLAIFGKYPVKDSPDYVLAKQCLHAANYRMANKRFSVEAGIPLQRASIILETYHANYPEIRRWHYWVRDQLFSKGYLKTPFGRERLFYGARAEAIITGKISNDSWRDAIAYVPQATVPDLTNLGMLALWEELPYIILHAQTHDGFLASVPIDKLGEAAEAVKRHLTRPIEINERTLTIPVEVACGYSWGVLKGWEEENTLSWEDWKTWADTKYPESRLQEDLLHTK